MRFIHAQIAHLVASLNKKNFKANSQELHSLVEQHGTAAQSQVILCLLKHINLLDGKGAKDQLHQTQVLQAFFNRALVDTSCASIVCKVFEAPDLHVKGKFAPNLISNLSKLLKLSPAYETILGFGLISSANKEIQSAGNSLVKSKLPDVLRQADASLPQSWLQQILLVLQNGQAVVDFDINPEDVKSYTAALCKAFPIKTVPAILRPFLYPDPFDVIGDQFVATASTPAAKSLLTAVRTQVNLAELMFELGYSCCATPASIKELLSQYGPAALTASTVAQVLGMMAHTPSGLDDSITLQVSPGEVAAWEMKAETNTQVVTTWNVELFVKGVAELVRDLNWRAVFGELDYPGFELRGVEGLSVLGRAFSTVAGSQFPVDVFFRPWTNVRGQLSVLRLLVEPSLAGSPQIKAALMSPGRQLPLEQVRALTNNPDQSLVPWICLDLVAALVSISQSEHFETVRRLVALPMQRFPEVVLLSLIQATDADTWTPLQDEFASSLLLLFLHNAHPTSTAMLTKVYQTRPELLLNKMVQWYRSAQDKEQCVSRILDVAQGLVALEALLKMSRDYDFVLDVAVLAAGRQFVNLEKWLLDRVRQAPTAVARAVVTLCQRRLQQFGPSDGVTMSLISTLRAAVQAGLAFSPDTLSSIKMLVDTYLVQSGPPSEVPTEPPTPTTPAGLSGPPSRQLSLGQQQSSSASDAAQRSGSIGSVTSLPWSLPGTGQAPPGSPGGPGMRGVNDFGPVPDSPGARQTAADTGDLSTRQFSQAIDDEANSYFQKIYTGQMTIDDVVNLLTTFKTSPNQKEQDVFACMIRNLFDEYRFFPQYPDKELGITGVLFGSLVQYQLVNFVSLGNALRYVLDALRKEPASKMHRFGLCALARFKDRLHEWPQYCHHICQIPHFSSFPPELVAACEAGRASRPAPGGQDMPGMGPPPAEAQPVQPAQPPQAAQPAATQPAQGGQQPSRGFDRPTLSTLLVAAENSSFAQPPEPVQDKVHFIFNNLSESNMQEKAREFASVIQPNYLGWLAHYIVVKRASIEANHHELFMQFIGLLNMPNLRPLVLHATLNNIKVLLKSQKIAASGSSSERTLLKNLGAWLGLQTLARNRPVFYRELAIKELLMGAYEMGPANLLFVTPFVAKVLECCKNSRVFRPPNPWTMAILGVLKELHQMPKLKLTLKFEIEVLCKNLEISIDDIRPSTVLKDAQAHREQLSLDQDVSSHQSPVTPGMHPGAPHFEVPQSPQQHGSPALPGAMPQPGGRARIANFPGLSTSSPANMQPFVTISPSITVFQQQPALKQTVQMALERAVTELINPLVERAVKIACVSCHKLVAKDFALEPDEGKLRKAAHVMVQHLAGNLSMVFSKDPLRVSIGTHLRSLLVSAVCGVPDGKPTPQQVVLIDQAVTTACNDNLDLACVFIEKTAMERAVPIIDDELAEDYADRRRYREMRPQPTQPYVNAQHFGNAAHALPALLRPKVGGLEPQQLGLYDNFARLLGAAPEADMSPMLPGDMGNAAAKQQQEVPSSATIDVHQALERTLLEVEKTAVRYAGRDFASLPQTNELHMLLRDVQSLVAQSPNRQDTIGRMCVKILYALVEGGLQSSKPLSDWFFVLLNHLQDSYRIATKEVTRAFLMMDNERRLNSELVAQLLRRGLLEPLEMDTFLVKFCDQGRNLRGIVFAEEVLQRCLLVEPQVKHLTPTEFIQTIDLLNKVAAAKPREQLRVLLEGINQLRKSTKLSLARSVAVKSAPDDPQGLRESVGFLFEEWIRLASQPQKSDKADTVFITRLLHQGMLKTDDISTRFFRLSADYAIRLCFLGAPEHEGIAQNVTNYHGVDAFAKLVVVLLKHFRDQTQVALLNKVLTTVVMVLTRDHRAHGPAFNQRPYFRLLCNLLLDVQMTADEGLNFQTLSALGTAFYNIRPAVCPGFTFAWMELISHRNFMPKLLLCKAQQPKGWQIFQRLLVHLLSHLAPFLRSPELAESIRTLYRGALRIMLVLLHDFPEFLCEFHFSFCDVIPPTCVQMRNLILSAFPRNIRLPDPFTPNLKVDLLPEIAQAPQILSDFAAALRVLGLQQDLDAYLAHRQPEAMLRALPARLLLGAEEAATAGTKFNVPLINSLVLYVGMKAIEQIKAGEGSITHGPAMDIFQSLAANLDVEGRYMFLNAIANQLRYPNSHTHYFSCVLLFLFAEAGQEIIKEQLTRVLLERLIVNRPHPWGLLITFIELIKNRAYAFWSHAFVRCAPEIERLFESVARSCMYSGRPGQGENPPA